MRRNLLVNILLVVFFSIFFLSPAQAQYRASLRGTVTYPQGAAVSGAKVTLADTNTGHTLVSTSDANGIYQCPARPRLWIPRLPL